ncbi:hypothetical protein HPHPH27_1451 [Helicobacter pylori Hp H-27]|nr:hypothetical protein HPHPH27_1451 [Helicobacter pylori Hp H-27]
MAWLETSNRFKDTPKISFKNASFKKRYSIKTLYNFLKKLLSEQPYLLKTAPMKMFLKSLDVGSPLKFVSQIQTIGA